MAYVHYNPNPWRLTTDDCTVRAISCVLGLDWDETRHPPPDPMIRLSR